MRAAPTHDLLAPSSPAPPQESSSEVGLEEDSEAAAAGSAAFWTTENVSNIHTSNGNHGCLIWTVHATPPDADPPRLLPAVMGEVVLAWNIANNRAAETVPAGVCVRCGPPGAFSSLSPAGVAALLCGTEPAPGPAAMDPEAAAASGGRFGSLGGWAARTYRSYYHEPAGELPSASAEKSTPAPAPAPEPSPSPSTTSPVAVPPAPEQEVLPTMLRYSMHRVSDRYGAICVRGQLGCGPPSGDDAQPPPPPRPGAWPPAYCTHFEVGLAVSSPPPEGPIPGRADAPQLAETSAATSVAASTSPLDEPVSTHGAAAVACNGTGRSLTEPTLDGESGPLCDHFRDDG